METPVLVAGIAVALVFLVCALTLVVRVRATRQRGLAEALAAARAETAELRDRLDALTEQLRHQSSTTIRGDDDPAYVITDAGRGGPRATLPDRVVLSAAVGEPLVKAMAFGHGLRRALSAQTRNRIGFEVRQEVRRARKHRRREMKDAWRRMQAEERAGQTTGRNNGSSRPADAA
jgi:hypothetical protein